MQEDGTSDTSASCYPLGVTVEVRQLIATVWSSPRTQKVQCTWSPASTPSP